MVAVISEPQSEEASKDLKVTVERLEKKIEPKDEIKEILEAQEVIDESLWLTVMLLKGLIRKLRKWQRVDQFQIILKKLL